MPVSLRPHAAPRKEKGRAGAVQPECARLATLLSHAPRGAFVFALYDTAAERERAEAALRKLLTPVPVFRYTLRRGRRNPLNYLRRVPRERQRKTAVIFIYDVERADVDEPETAWAYLDTQRENLSACPHALVFWVTEQGARDAARCAPNTWSQRSAVFDFRAGRRR
jgi:hypothetical protein